MLLVAKCSCGIHNLSSSFIAKKNKSRHHTVHIVVSTKRNVVIQIVGSSGYFSLNIFVIHYQLKYSGKVKSENSH